MTNTELSYTILGTSILLLILINYYGIRNYVEPTEVVEEKEPEIEIFVKPKRAYKKRTPKIVVETPIKKVRSVKKSIPVE